MKTTSSHTGDPESFAFETARVRWPAILKRAASEVDRTIEGGRLSDGDATAGVELYKKILDLERAIRENEDLRPIGEIDYDKELGTLDTPTWLNAPWLYAECYLYQLLDSFASTPFWQTFDVFASEKRNALLTSSKGAIELVKRFNMVSHWDHKLLDEMLQISLWGNATDLSLLTIDQLESRQGKAARDASKQHVLVDDTLQVEELLASIKSASIHIVLDNAGFELLADLVLAGYLIESGVADSVVLHGKNMPWFVSDVMEMDLAELVTGLAEGTTFPTILPEDKREIIRAGKYWQGLLQSGKMTFLAESFWTTAHPFGKMADVDPHLFSALANADLVIYKGDLNYRKLVSDQHWPYTTSFREALGPLAKKHDGKGMRILALRTAKADVAVGLTSEQLQTLPEHWTRTGKYAMISYFDAS